MLSPSSSADDVHAWLEANEFNAETQAKLSGLTGQELLALDKEGARTLLQHQGTATRLLIRLRKVREALGDDEDSGGDDAGAAAATSSERKRKHKHKQKKDKKKKKKKSQREGSDGRGSDDEDIREKGELPEDEDTKKKKKKKKEKKKKKTKGKPKTKKKTKDRTKAGDVDAMPVVDNETGSGEASMDDLDNDRKKKKKKQKKNTKKKEKKKKKKENKQTQDTKKKKEKKKRARKQEQLEPALGSGPASGEQRDASAASVPRSSLARSSLSRTSASSLRPRARSRPSSRSSSRSASRQASVDLVATGVEGRGSAFSVSFGPDAAGSHLQVNTQDREARAQSLSTSSGPPTQRVRQQSWWQASASDLSSPAGKEKKTSRLMSQWANKLRRVVSQKKRRFQQDGFDLDLSYITDNVVAMGFPSEGAAGLYRNNMKDVQRFFQTYHPGKFKVYNLCSEKSYPASKFTELGGMVAHYPFDDHDPCSFQMMIDFCADAKAFVDEAEGNVIAIHCRGGKGRTGLLVCAFLLYTGVCSGADETMLFYSDARTSDGRGVTGPSQRRYVRYCAQYLAEHGTSSSPGGGFDFQGRPMVLEGFELNYRYTLKKGTMKDCEPYFKLVTPEGTVFYNQQQRLKGMLPKWQVTERVYKAACPRPIIVRGDVVIRFYDGTRSSKKIFYFWLHTSFLPEQGELKLAKNQMEGCFKDTKDEKFDAYFTCKCLLRPATDAEMQILEQPQADGHREESDGEGTAAVGADDPPARPGTLSRALSLNHLRTNSASSNGSGSRRRNGEPPALGGDRDGEGPPIQAPAAGTTLLSAFKKTGGLGKALKLKVKHVVSQQRRRFQEDGFDLDLSYITKQMIAMGFPSEGAAGLYRNNMKDVQRFFQTYYPGKFKVYNLCSEKSYDSSKFESLGGKVAAYPFDDHHPCELETLVAFCDDALRFLAEAPDHVVAIHCKGGKGRTGLMCCALLLFSEQCKTADEAMTFYSDARTFDGRGVTGASQRRYVKYVEQYLAQYRRMGKSMVPRTLLLTGFRLVGYPKLRDKGIMPYFKLLRASDGKVLYNQLKHDDTPMWKGDRAFNIQLYPVEVSDDIHIAFYDNLGSKGAKKKKSKLFEFWVHAAFIGDKLQVKLEKAGLDHACKDKKHKVWPEQFHIVVQFSDAAKNPLGQFGVSKDSGELVSLFGLPPPPSDESETSSDGDSDDDTSSSDDFVEEGPVTATPPPPPPEHLLEEDHSSAPPSPPAAGRVGPAKLAPLQVAPKRTSGGPQGYHAGEQSREHAEQQMSRRDATAPAAMRGSKVAPMKRERRGGVLPSQTPDQSANESEEESYDIEAATPKKRTPPQKPAPTLPKSSSGQLKPSRLMDAPIPSSDEDDSSSSSSSSSDSDSTDSDVGSPPPLQPAAAVQATPAAKVPPRRPPPKGPPPTGSSSDSDSASNSDSDSSSESDDMAPVPKSVSALKPPPGRPPSRKGSDDSSSSSSSSSDSDDFDAPPLRAAALPPGGASSSDDSESD